MQSSPKSHFWYLEKCGHSLGPFCTTFDALSLVAAGETVAARFCCAAFATMYVLDFAGNDVGFAIGDFDIEDVGLDGENVGFDTEDVCFDTDAVGFVIGEVGFGFEKTCVDTTDAGFDTEDVGFDTGDVGFATVGDDDVADVATSSSF